MANRQRWRFGCRPAGSECSKRFSAANLSCNRKRWRLAETPLHFVILGRSKERSDAAQTLGSIP
ncbi:MAG: hypothetical protein EOQ86_24660 [Mesorhizobium sp.]|nr:MAG: hypothetical protein EOQ86_24660 [Mesorhizobium sp.]RWH97589.1 MAG: hypothetical protein EOQ89_24905 [Mesorhizobium sp.]RWI07584.1 MAG: hypothetical protein EOQ90_22335 [Mesorhizobium sp.]RWI14679.1 MAG: hypothetical protein EOQ91_24560 [Mesorhizobium sp.]TJV32938.1 MAG: hypothetical protein E5X87_14705 [Mesorhizobium sp.]